MRHAVVRKTKLVKQQARLHPGPADCDEGLAQGSHPTVAKAQLRAIDFNTEQRLGETKRVERGRELRGATHTQGAQARARSAALRRSPPRGPRVLRCACAHSTQARRPQRSARGAASGTQPRARRPLAVVGRDRVTRACTAPALSVQPRSPGARRRARGNSHRFASQAHLEPCASLRACAPHAREGIARRAPFAPALPPRRP